MVPDPANSRSMIDGSSESATSTLRHSRPSHHVRRSATSTSSTALLCGKRNPVREDRSGEVLTGSEERARIAWDIHQSGCSHRFDTER